MKIKSPLFYNGNKYTLLDKIMPHIPKNKEGTFYDLFGGSATMSFNFAKHYKKVIYSEFAPHVYKMAKWAEEMTEQGVKKLRNRMLELNEKYGFVLNVNTDKEAKMITASGKSNEREEYKGWLRFIKEEKITIDSDPELLYIASCFSFSHTLKFKNDGYLQASWGVQNWTESFFNNFLYASQFKNIEMYNMSFEDQDIDALTKNDFVYLDPPYWGTQGNYNKFWTWELECKMLEHCEKLNQKGIKFAMSNVFKNKGKVNQHLIDWADKNGFKVYKFEHKYTVNGSTGDAEEVLICNYEYDENPEQLSLF